MTANISATGLLFALDTADPRVIRDCPAQRDDPLELAIALKATPVTPAPTSISCSARYVRAAVAPGRIILNATAVAVDAWQLRTAPAA